MGRPTKKDPNTISLVAFYTSQDPQISAESISKILNAEHDIQVGPTVINEIRNSEGFFFRPGRICPYLTEDHKKKRMNFCYTVLRNGINHNIGFSDESRFCLGPDKRWIWIKRGDNNPATFRGRQKFPKSIMVWGMIAKDHKSNLQVLTETLTSLRYQRMLIFEEILTQAEAEVPDFLFQQDGAPAHKAKESKKTIRSICDLMDNWPPNSPDLNVIELLWAIMKNALNRENPTTKEELPEVVLGVWDSIQTNTINDLVDSFTKRCYLCLKKRGACIQHLIQGQSEPTEEQIRELLREVEAMDQPPEVVDLILEKLPEEAHEQLQKIINKLAYIGKRKVESMNNHFFD